MEKKSKHLVAKEYREFLENVSAQLSLGEAHEAIANLGRILEGYSENEIGQELVIDGPEEGQKLSLYVYRSHQAKEDEVTPCILWFHGGGYAVGNATMEGDDCRLMAEDHNATVISVEYRVTTIAPHPAPLMDAYTALEYVYDHAQELKVDKDKIIIAGESGGGGLAACLALYAKDKGRIHPVGEFLIYPQLDCRTGGKDDPYQNEYAGEYLVTKNLLPVFWEKLIGDANVSEHDKIYYSPSLAKLEDLAGLPDTSIIVGGLDAFVNECLHYADNLLKAGVMTELYIEPGVPHAYELLPDTPQVKRSNEFRHNAIERMFGR